MQHIDTIVIGGGQAGLAMSYCLRERGIDHFVLEASPELGGSWRNRWDSFCLVTPNHAIRLPGFAYRGPDPSGFMPRDAVIRYLQHYATVGRLPVHLGVRVQSLRFHIGGTGYRLETTAGSMCARNVVVATGAFQRPRTPSASAELATSITQLHSDMYRTPAQLPAGAVLVVGSTQSGVQIVEDLQAAGREVFLSTSRAGRLPRRYRGRDFFDWMILAWELGPQVGMSRKTVSELPSPAARFASNPQLTGRD